MLRACGIVIVLAALAPGAALADVYRCVDKERGTTTYQDAPCPPGRDGGVVKMPEQPPPPPESATRAANDAARQRIDAMAVERRRREISNEIAGLDRQLAQITAEEAAELQPLRDRKAFIANNLAGDPFGQADIQRSLDAEMQAVSEKYRDRADNVRRRLVALRAEAGALPRPAAQ